MKISQPISKTILIGAGVACKQFLREHYRQKDPNRQIVSILDDNESLSGKEILSHAVAGTTQHLKKIIQSSKADEIILTFVNPSREQISHIINCIDKRPIKLKRLRYFASTQKAQVRVTDVTDIQAEDLLGRAPITQTSVQAQKFYAGQTILITGAGGSIGSKIAEALILCGVKNLILADFSEFNLYRLKFELSSLKLKQTQIIIRLIDFTNAVAVNDLFNELKINVVFHAAAYKHVPLLEENPQAGIVNNLGSTINLANACEKFNVKKFVLISTDKAVEPSSVMGKTKRLCEIYLLAQSKSKVAFQIVRFGNVLGSSGSVVPLFLTQIREGGPVTLTHPEMTRYFMLIEEAAFLVLSAAASSNKNELMILNMGDPVKISELAEQMILLSGKTIGSDIKVKYIGLRPGEKLTEKLHYDFEKIIQTKDKKIQKIKTKILSIDFKFMLEGFIENLKSRGMKNPQNLLNLIMLQAHRKLNEY